MKRPGGMWREQAIAEAVRLLEGVKQDCLDELDVLIGGLEAIHADSALSRKEILDRLDAAADTIITVAGTYEYVDLVKAAMCLGDLARGLQTQEERSSGLLRIPLDTIRLLSPKAEPLDEASRDRLLEGLYSLRQHIGVVPDGTVA
ncbi:MAG TPA: hypothetical protein VMF58_13625 [Rhizomicrobium sp.]|nr:hypothetical protein [Rhizomicrobium sp.]